MLISIDKYMTVAGVTILVGWCSEFNPTTGLRLVRNGLEIPTTVYAVDRPDVAAVHGPGAERWGFRAYGTAEQAEIIASDMGLRFGSGVEIGSLVTLPRPVGENPHELWASFVDRVNSHGGTVLEVGARARSGHTRRELFASGVEYIGFDITDGPNVDIVGDAHSLSNAIKKPVDYIFSISTFEHLLMPWKVVLEFNRLLAVGGMVFSHSHQTWPIHDEPWDFFRFSKWSWSSLYNIHTGFKILDARQGEPVAIMNFNTPGGSFDGMDKFPGWGLSVSLAEKVADPKVAWNADVDEVAKIEYHY